MQEPSPRSSRLVLAAALSAVVVLGGGGFLIGRATLDRNEIILLPAAKPDEKEPQPLAASAVMDRAALIELARVAADNFAAGTANRAAGPEINGRRFQLRLPFGCEGPSQRRSTDSMRWHYDRDAQTLRLSVTPTRWTATDWWPDTAHPTVDAIEGYWIERPWTSSEACTARVPPVASQPEVAPSAPSSSVAKLPAEQTLALGQIFYADGARSGQRQGKAHDLVLRIAPDKLDAAMGFRLRLSGRIAASAGAEAVLCRQSGGADQRPVCLISVMIDEVAIENPLSGETLALWTMAKGDVAVPL